MPLPVPTEKQEALTLVAYLRLKGLKFTHVGNETGHSPEARRRAISLKQQGTSRGFPDYCIIVGNSLIFIELKRRKGSATSPEQHAWIAALNEVGNVQAFICKGADEAIAVVEKYLPKVTGFQLKHNPKTTTMF